MFPKTQFIQLQNDSFLKIDSLKKNEYYGILDIKGNL